jgi:hypothetical protein
MTGLIGSIVGGPAAWALGALGAVKRGVGSAVDWAGKSSSRLLIVALAVAIAGGLWERHSAHKWHATADRNAQTIKTERLAYVAAQSAAKALAVANKMHVEAIQTQQTKEADDARKPMQDDAARRAAAYAASHGVRDCAAQGAGRRADLPGAASPAPVAAGQAGDAELVVVSRKDFNLCTINSTDLLDGHNWAVKIRPPHP